MRVSRGTLGAVAVVALFAAACGSSGPEVSSPKRTATAPAASADAGHENSDGTRTVSYQGVDFEVPGDWPVYDLSADPSTCVRYDVHAVYLGHASSDMQCPAHLAGRTETVQVEPVDADALHSTGEGATAQDVNGLSVTVDPAVAGQLEVGVPSADVVATLTFSNSDATARQIVSSFRAATK